MRLSACDHLPVPLELLETKTLLELKALLRFLLVLAGYVGLKALSRMSVGEGKKRRGQNWVVSGSLRDKQILPEGDPVVVCVVGDHLHKKKQKKEGSKVQRVRPSDSLAIYLCIRAMRSLSDLQLFSMDGINPFVQCHGREAPPAFVLHEVVTCAKVKIAWNARTRSNC